MNTTQLYKESSIMICIIKITTFKKEEHFTFKIFTIFKIRFVNKTQHKNAQITHLQNQAYLNHGLLFFFKCKITYAQFTQQLYFLYVHLNHDCKTVIPYLFQIMDQLFWILHTRKCCTKSRFLISFLVFHSNKSSVEVLLDSFFFSF